VFAVAAEQRESVGERVAFDERHRSLSDGIADGQHRDLITRQILFQSLQFAPVTTTLHDLDVGRC
jgi:hypothetical protein